MTTTPGSTRPPHEPSDPQLRERYRQDAARQRADQRAAAARAAAEAPPSRTPRGLIRVVAGLLTLALVALAGLVMLGPMLRQSETRETALPADVSRLQVHNDVGDVRVRPIAAGETPRVSSTTKWGLRRPISSVTTSGDGAALRGSCPGIAATVCRTDWLVLLPRGTDLRIDQGGGRVTLEEPSGDVDIRSGVGSISVTEATASRISIELGVGDVAYEGIEPPEALDVSIGVGDTAVRLPHAVPYRITTSGGAAEVINHLDHEPSAPRSVSVEAGVGSITLDPS